VVYREVVTQTPGVLQESGKLLTFHGRLKIADLVQVGGAGVVKALAHDGEGGGDVAAQRVELAELVEAEGLGSKEMVVLAAELEGVGTLDPGDVVGKLEAVVV